MDLNIYTHLLALLVPLEPPAEGPPGVNSETRPCGSHTAGC